MVGPHTPTRVLNASRLVDAFSWVRFDNPCVREGVECGFADTLKFFWHALFWSSAVTRRWWPGVDPCVSSTRATLDKCVEQSCDENGLCECDGYSDTDVMWSVIGLDVLTVAVAMAVVLLVGFVRTAVFGSSPFLRASQVLVRGAIFAAIAFAVRLVIEMSNMLFETDSSLASKHLPPDVASALNKCEAAGSAMDIIATCVKSGSAASANAQDTGTDGAVVPKTVGKLIALQAQTTTSIVTGVILVGMLLKWLVNRAGRPETVVAEPSESANADPAAPVDAQEAANESATATDAAMPDDVPAEMGIGKTADVSTPNEAATEDEGEDSEETGDDAKGESGAEVVTTDADTPQETADAPGEETGDDAKGESGAEVVTTDADTPQETADAPGEETGDDGKGESGAEVVTTDADTPQETADAPGEETGDDGKGESGAEVVTTDADTPQETADAPGEETGDDGKGESGAEVVTTDADTPQETADAPATESNEEADDNAETDSGASEGTIPVKAIEESGVRSDTPVPTPQDEATIPTKGIEAAAAAAAPVRKEPAGELATIPTKGIEAAAAAVAPVRTGEGDTTANKKQPS